MVYCRMQTWLRTAPTAIRRIHLSAWCEIVLIAAGLVISCFFLPHSMNSDSTIRYAGLNALLQSGKVLPIRYSLIGPVFATPLWLIGTATNATLWWCMRFNLVIFAGGMMVMSLLLRRYMSSSLLRRQFLLLLVASMFSWHLLTFDAEVFTAILVAVGCVALVIMPGLGGWLALVLGVANTPASVIGLVLLTAKHMLDTRRMRYILLVVAAVALILTEAWAQRGNPLNTGYEGDHGFQTILPYSGLPGFSYPPFLGLLSILFSFGKGLIFFAPALFLPARQRLLAMQPGDASDKTSGSALYKVYTLWQRFLAGLVLVYMSWWAWYGGWFWGPRFFLFASIPASFALALWLSKPSSSILANVGVLMVFCLSLWVGIDGVAFNQHTLNTVCQYHDYAQEYLCQYVPEFSPLWRPFIVHERLDGVVVSYIAYSMLVGAYLVMPVLVRIGWQLRERVAGIWKDYLCFRDWRF